MTEERGNRISERPAADRQRVGPFLQAFTFLGGPLAWLGFQNLAYALFSIPCFPASGRNPALPQGAGWVWILAIAVFVICAAVAFLSGVAGLRLLRRNRGGQAGPSDRMEHARIGRARFIGCWGVLLGFGFAFMVLANGAGLLLVPSCAM